MAYGSILNQNPILRDANGYIVFTSSGTFNPADFNLPVGTLLNIVCVGGGQGGLKGSGDGGAAGQGGKNSGNAGGGGSGGGFGAGGGGGGDYATSSGTSATSGAGGDAGEVVITSMMLTSTNSISVTIGNGGTSNGGKGGSTKFGSYVTARGGGTFTNTIAKGGSGETRNASTSKHSYASGGGGGGGYIISNGLFGGNGGNGNSELGEDNAFGSSGFIGGGGGNITNESFSEIMKFNPASSVYGGNGGMRSQEGGSAGIGSGLCIVAW